MGVIREPKQHAQSLVQDGRVVDGIAGNVKVMALFEFRVRAVAQRHAAPIDDKVAFILFVKMGLVVAFHAPCYANYNRKIGQHPPNVMHRRRVHTIPVDDVTPFVHRFHAPVVDMNALVALNGFERDSSRFQVGYVSLDKRVPAIIGDGKLGGVRRADHRNRRWGGHLSTNGDFLFGLVPNAQLYPSQTKIL